MVLTMKRTIAWVVSPCSSERARRFGGIYLLPLRDRRARQAKNQQKLTLPPGSADSCLVYPSTMNIEVMCSPKHLALPEQRPEDHTLNDYFSRSLFSCIQFMFVL
jgi:hypothetical protein